MKRNRLRLLQTINRCISAILLVLLLVPAYSQQKNQPLRVVLDSLESRYDVVFSFGDKTVEDKQSALPDPVAALEACLDQLRESTGLIFEKLDSRYIAIRDPSSRIYCGYLLDKNTREPVQYAIIHYDKGGAYETSDKDGFFRFNKMDLMVKLTVNHVGYMDISIEASPGAVCDTIYLESRISELAEIYVSNYLVKGLDKRPFGELEVNPRTLQVLPGLSEPDVLFTLQVLPGVQSPNESVADLNIRGGNNDENLILWDGIRMFQSGHFFGLISAFNPYFTEDLTLIKNGSSARYGESVSGILDINTTNDVKDEFSGGGGFNFLGGDAHLDIPVSSRISLSMAARRSVTDLVSTPTYEKYYERAFANTDIGVLDQDEEFKFYDLSAKLNFRPSQSDKVNLSLIRIANDLMYSEEDVVDGKTEKRISSLNQENKGVGLRYERNWSDRWTTSLDSYLSSYRLSAINNDIANQQILFQDNEVLDFGFFFDSRINFSEFVSWQNGFQFEETGITNLEDLNNPVFKRRIKEVLSRYVGYSEFTLFARQAKTNLRFGMRASYYHQLSEFMAEPRFTFKQELSPAISFELMGEFKNQTISQIIDLQTDFLGVEKRRWVLSNGRDFPIVQSKQVSGGLLYSSHRMMVSAEGYYKVVDGIVTSGQGFQNQFEFIRAAGSYETYGGEFMYSKQMDRFSAWGSYSLSWNRYLFTDLYLLAFPNNRDVRHNLNVGSLVNIDHFEVSSGVYWHSGVPYTPVELSMPVVNNEIQYMDPNIERLEPYFRLDLSAKYSFHLGDKMTNQVGFSLWNLTNYPNNLRIFYETNDQTDVVKVRQDGLRFTSNLFFRASF